MSKKPKKPDWYLVDGVATWWDGESWLSNNWTEPKGWYEFEGDAYYWDGKEWYANADEVDEEDEVDDEETDDNLYTTNISPDFLNNYKSGKVSDCKNCGDNPAELIILQSASSRIIWWNHSKINVELCAICAEHAYLRQQSRTLIQGWWGPLSALATVWFSISNLVRIDKHRKRIPTIEYNEMQIARPRLKVRSNPGVIIASIIALSIIGYFGSSFANQPTPISDSTPTSYNGSCWHDNGGDKLSQVNCTSSEADYETYQVVSDPSLCASTYIAAGTQYACLQNKY
jgi:hypothetical protein